MIKFIKEKCTDIKENENGMQFAVPLVYLKKFKILQDNEDKYDRAFSIINKSVIVTLVSQFDKYISDTIKYMLTLKPNLLNDSCKQISYTELIKYKTIEEYQSAIINEEIDAVMRGSHIKQLEWISKKINGSIKDDKELISKFVELTERRNLYVHTNGIVSSQYINTCIQEGFTFKQCPNIGDELYTDPDYFYDSVFVLIEIAGKITSFIIKKLHPENIEIGKNLLITYIYDNLEYKNYNIVRNLIKYLKIYSKLNRIEDMIVSINNIITYYLLNKDEEVKKQIDKLDWSDCSDKFLLAKAVLQKDWVLSSKIMRKIGNTDELPQIFYHEWPLFELFRDTKEFKDAYKEVFKCDYDKIDSEKEIIDEIVTS